MQRVERTIDEELDYMEEIFEARDEVLEERRLLGAGHIEEDEDFLYNLERARVQVVLQKVTSEANPKVRNHGEGPY